MASSSQNDQRAVIHTTFNVVFRLALNKATMIFAALILLFLLSLSKASMVVRVATEDEVCFVFRAPPNSVVSGSFDVLEDNLSPDPVTVKLLDEEYAVLYSSRHGISEDLFRIEATGRLSICVQNGITHESEDELDRTVGIDVRVSPKQKADEKALEMIDRAYDLQDKLWNLQNHHDYMRNREAAHREVTERTYINVVRWTVLEFVALATIAIGQVLVLRMFFEKRRTL